MGTPVSGPSAFLGGGGGGGEKEEGRGGGSPVSRPREGVSASDVTGPVQSPVLSPSGGIGEGVGTPAKPGVPPAPGQDTLWSCSLSWLEEFFLIIFGSHPFC